MTEIKLHVIGKATAIFSTENSYTVSIDRVLRKRHVLSKKYSRTNKLKIYYETGYFNFALKYKKEEERDVDTLKLDSILEALKQCEIDYRYTKLIYNIYKKTSTQPANSKKII